MIHSSYYQSFLDSASRPFSEPVFVVGEHEVDLCGELVAGALAGGARTIVVERGRVASYCRPFEQDLADGVVYFFVRSLPNTLSRWRAAPLTGSKA